MLYAGYKKVNPNHKTFMSKDGYKTSSPKIHRLIDLDGLSSFEIVDIILEEEILIPFGWSSIYQYETWFLESNNCASSKLWLNVHNNHSPIGKPDDTGKLAESRRDSLLTNYGIINVSQLESVKKSKKKTMIKNYGSLELAMENKTKKQIESNLKNFGVEHTWQREDVKQKQKETLLEKYGVDNISKSDEHKLKKIETCRQNYGVDNYSQTPESKQKLSERNSIQNKIVRTCPHCNFTGMGNNMFRYHFDNCIKLTGIPHQSVKPSEEVQCPHCNKIGKARGMKSKHFDRCPTILPIKEKIRCPHCNKEGNDNGYFKSFHISKCKGII